MKTLYCLLHLRWLLLIRWVRDNLFDALVLSPLILYGAYLALGAHIEKLLSRLPALLSSGFWGTAETFGLFLAVKLVFSWKGTIEELNPQSSPDICLLYLPVPKVERFISIFLYRASKNSLLIVFLGTLLLSPLSPHIPLLAGAGVLATCLEMGSGLLWIGVAPRLFPRSELWQHTAAIPSRKIVAILGFALRKVLRRRATPDLPALVVRDSLLTIRFFSFGVVLHFLAALLCLAAMASLLPGVGNEPRAVQVVTGLTTAYGVALIALISPRLLKFQLPYLWIERSAPISVRSIWQAKVWHANAVALFFPVLVILIRLWILPTSVGQAFLVGVEQLLIGVLVASFIGALIFETHQQPWLGVLFSGLGATAFALMMVLLHWGLFFILFPQLMHFFAERGENRIRFLLWTHDPN